MIFIEIQTHFLQNYGLDFFQQDVNQKHVPVESFDFFDAILLRRGFNLSESHAIFQQFLAYFRYQLVAT